MIRTHLPGRVQFIDERAPDHPEYTIHSIELASEPFPFLTIWCKGQVAPFRETEHDPLLFHLGERPGLLSLVDEVFADKKYRIAGWKQHFHVRLYSPATLADVEPFSRWMHPVLWAEIVRHLGAV